MPDQNRRSLAELVTRYQFHPELRDLLVEGERDISVFRWFLSSLPKSRGVVYHVNSVDLTAEDCESVGVYGGGNKGRVIALARILDAELPPRCVSVLCCVDRDCLDFELPYRSYRYLIHMDFACLECYALGQKSLYKLFITYLGTQITPGEIDSMMDVLRYVFSVRLAKRRLAPDAAWFDRFTKCCSLHNGRVRLDKQAYLSRVLNVADGLLPGESVERETKWFAAQSLADMRLAVHGHDAVHLLRLVGLLVQRALGEILLTKPPCTVRC